MFERYDSAIPGPFLKTNIKNWLLANQADAFAQLVTDAADFGIAIPLNPNPQIKQLALYVFTTDQIRFAAFGATGQSLVISLRDESGRELGSLYGRENLSIVLSGETGDYSEPEIAGNAAEYYEWVFRQLMLRLCAKDAAFDLTLRPQKVGESDGDYGDYCQRQPQFTLQDHDYRCFPSEYHQQGYAWEVTMRGTLTIQEME